MNDVASARFDGPGFPDLSLRARRVLRCDPPDYQPTLFENFHKVRKWNDPLDALHWLTREANDHAWIGYLSYDLGRLFERFPAPPTDDLSLPLFAFMSGENGTKMPLRANVEVPPRPIVSDITRAEYESKVRHVLEYISAGDVFQVNLAQRFVAACTEPALDIYGRLQSASPATYAALLDFGDFQLLSNSPELFLEVTDDRRIITRPIKGTRPVIPGKEVELRDSLKDQAELNMIVDLERNDLGRICEIGSVRVTQPRTIERHPTVYHGVATIEGKLRNDVSFVDVLRATFPGGSVTGAPKIRAMQIIDEIEPTQRGPYCGAIGVLKSDGSAKFNLAIRTMILKDRVASISVGGGIVADSDPLSEYIETLVKARAMFDALHATL